MPTVREEITPDPINVEIEFQLWCNICGNGICGNTVYKKGTINHFTTYCEKCEKERDNLELKIEQLNQDINDLKDEVKILNS